MFAITDRGELVSRHWENVKTYFYGYAASELSHFDYWSLTAVKPTSDSSNYCRQKKFLRVLYERHGENEISCFVFAARERLWLAFNKINLRNVCD